MKKETVTGYFVIMTEYTVEIAVEQESEVLSLHRFNFNMLQRSKTYDFVLFQLYGNMVYLQSQVSTPHPNELI